MINVQTLIDAVTKLKTVDEGVIKTIQTLAANQKDLAAQLAAAIAAGDPVAIQAVQTSINESAQAVSDQADALAKAVTDGTVAA